MRISGLKLKIIARASLKKKAANTEVITGQKIFFPIGSPNPLKMENFFWFHDQLIFFHQTLTSTK